MKFKWVLFFCLLKNSTKPMSAAQLSEEIGGRYEWPIRVNCSHRTKKRVQQDFALWKKAEVQPYHGDGLLPGEMVFRLALNAPPGTKYLGETFESMVAV